MKIMFNGSDQQFGLSNSRYRREAREYIYIYIYAMVFCKAQECYVLYNLLLILSQK
jgi:hypothetical protein